MLKGLGDIGQLMKMQRDLKNAQKNIAKTKIEGESRNGEVKVVITGENRVHEIKIDEDFFKKGDKKGVETALAAALNDAAEKLKSFSMQEMSKLTGGMDLGGIMNMFK